jgi:hypothetical protein
LVETIGYAIEREHLIQGGSNIYSITSSSIIGLHVLSKYARNRLELEPPTFIPHSGAINLNTTTIHALEDPTSRFEEKTCAAASA